ncbi:MAG: hypothetical protein DME76_14645 [Verrucomicrobia bacterium]|nr:MAG: hypothetical protein DME76_14645 [Verrucomicrobiota bacterium]
MKQSEPVNPRVMWSERTAGCVYESPVAAEISGYIDIGMKDEALRLTRKVLEKRRILPDEFSAAVRISKDGDTKLKPHTIGNLEGLSARCAPTCLGYTHPSTIAKSPYN